MRVNIRQPENGAAVRDMIASPGGGPTALRIMLGAQLRRLREAKRITLEDAGYAIRASGSKMSRLETGRVGFKSRDIADLLTLYGVTDEQEREVPAGAGAAQASALGWWHDYADVMPAWFEPYVGPRGGRRLDPLLRDAVRPRPAADGGLRPRRRDARPPGVPDEEIERRVSLRMARQSVLTRATPGASVGVLDEAALRRPLGGPTSCAASSST